VFKNLERVYVVTLSKDADSPFKPKSDEVDVAAAKADDKPADAKDAKKDAEPKPVVVKVDPDGSRTARSGCPSGPPPTTRSRRRATRSTT